MDKEKIKISDKIYSVEQISQIYPHILKIEFTDVVPSNLGDIIIYTAGGIPATTLTGYNTVYHRDGKTLYLSNDGSIFKNENEERSV